MRGPSISLLLPLVLSLAAAAPLAAAPKRNIELVLDCSGSMEKKTTRFTSYKDKVDMAKEEVRRYVQRLPAGEVRLALRVFGTDRDAGCQDSALLHPLAELDRDAFVARLAPVRPAYFGKTPIAHSLGKALQDFRALPQDGTENVIILLTDGIESCGGDVDGAIDAIRAAGIGLKVNIIGFDVLESGDGGEAAKELTRMAESTGGKADFPKTQAELEQSLKGVAGVGPASTSAPPPPPGGILAAIRANLFLVAVLGMAFVAFGGFLALRSGAADEAVETGEDEA